MDYTLVVQMVVVSNPSNGQEDRSKTNHGINAGERTGLCCRLHTVPRRAREARVANSRPDFSAGLGQINRPIRMIFGLLVKIQFHNFKWPLSVIMPVFKPIISPLKVIKCGNIIIIYTSSKAQKRSLKKANIKTPLLGKFFLLIGSNYSGLF